ncbi:unnamed protein product [Pleuronectes platessa]|uniref:Uncharacterized protein n=1 Tax=Pleuronectes platessa TaxID=8262 RepID=A0A9N7YYP8_PLEPL|nr:unnamed protein product [Pleuronectes platessa]
MSDSVIRAKLLKAFNGTFGTTVQPLFTHTPLSPHGIQLRGAQGTDIETPTLLGAMGADSLVPQGPEPVMDRVVTNELLITQMVACGLGQSPCLLCRAKPMYTGVLGQPALVAAWSNTCSLFGDEGPLGAKMLSDTDYARN